MVLITRQLFEVLGPAGRRQFVVLLVLAVLAALFQVLGVGAVLPFIALASQPSLLHTNSQLANLYQSGGFHSFESFCVAAGVLVIVALLLSNVVNAWATYYALRFAGDCRFDLSLRLLRNYAYKPYLYYIENNSATLNRDVLDEIYELVRSFISPFATAVVNGATVLTLLVALVAIDPVVAVGTGVVLGGGYLLIYRLCQRRLNEDGEARLAADGERFKLSSELLAGQREARLTNSRETFIRRFEAQTKITVDTTVSSGLISQLPRQALEVLGVFLIVLMILYYIAQGQSISDFLPRVSAYVLCSARLMPRLQALFLSVSTARYATASMGLLYPELTYETPLTTRSPKPIAWDEAIRLESLTYAYPRSNGPVLSGFSVEIKKNTSVAFVGSTGSGKTTLVNILLGLLEPDVGQLKLDSKVISQDIIPDWRATVGFVPQDIFLTDDTLAANIAYGLAEDERDPQVIEEAARMARIHEFIIGLPEGYQTVVGERGVRLSGGQRQRLGIARALYRNPSILVLDEATSALDGLTEDAVMESIRTLSGSKTLILIAHRITTLKECDCIYVLENGVITDSGTYDELLASNETFRGFAKVGPSEAAGASENQDARRSEPKPR